MTIKYREKNLYNSFIEILQQKAQKGFEANVLLHKHHILPKHDGGPADGPLVVCTVRDHARAHYIRYKVYGQVFDQMAYFGLVGRTDELEALRFQKIVETNRARGNGPFSKEWQKEMANRPKSSYHFQKTPEFARSIASRRWENWWKSYDRQKNGCFKTKWLQCWHKIWKTRRVKTSTPANSTKIMFIY